MPTDVEEQVKDTSSQTGRHILVTLMKSTDAWPPLWKILIQLV